MASQSILKFDAAVREITKLATSVKATGGFGQCQDGGERVRWPGWIFEATADTKNWELEEQWARDRTQMVYVRIKVVGIKRVPSGV